MTVFHLKYRPVLISDLDSIDAADKLKKILSNKEMPQSFLFAGPKGSGKTSAARILARAINCENPKNGEPCGECGNCKEVGNGNSIDIIEIDAASNRGIDDIRSLKDKAYLLPSKLKKKVFIIDEVHMLTKDAFNALLKLIEEPPKHTVFVLCTTDVEKIPETVLSRLTRIDFRKGTDKELKKALDKVIKGEEIEIENEVIEFLIKKSDGSFRNLHRDFNEIYLHLGKKIILDGAMNFYKSRGGGYNEADFETDLDNGETKIILEKLEKMADEGVDFSNFRQRLLNYFQEKILLNFEVGDGEKSVLNLEELEFLMDLLVKASKQEKEVEIDQLPLELVVIDFISQKRQDKKKVEKSNLKEKKVETKDEVEIKEEVVPVDISGINLEKIEQSWGNILMAIKPFNHSVEAFLRASRPIKINGRNLTLEVFYPFHKDRLEETKNRKLVEDGIKKVLGVEMVFECILGKSRKEPLVIQNNTPVESINEKLVEGKNEDRDLYDVAKDIFG